VAVTGVLAVFLVLACAALFWVIKNYKSSVIRSYQLNELDISDPIASELKSLALKLAAIQDEADDCDGMTKKHVEHTVKQPLSKRKVKGQWPNIINPLNLNLYF
jgi:hypothetical protein